MHVFMYVLYVCILIVYAYHVYLSCMCDSTSKGIETTYQMKTWLAELDVSKQKKTLFFKDVGPDGMWNEKLFGRNNFDAVVRCAPYHLIYSIY